MYLSDAIRLGSMMGPQCFHTLESEDGGTCALGAALAATNTDRAEFRRTWPYAATPATCPVCGESKYFNGRVHSEFFLEGIIATHLNDKHGWTREQIADWVEEQEYRLGIRVKEVVKDEVPELQEVR